MAMVKADAYGHGLVPVAKALRDADGLAVARLQEAIALRRAGLTQRILLLGTLLDSNDVAECSALSIDVTAHDARSVEVIAAAARHQSLRVWLKLDSGMHRAGMDAQAFVEADRLLTSLPGIGELTHMTHFSSAEDLSSEATGQQIRCFFDCHQVNPSAKASLANSAALISRPDVHADWVRPGIMLYGGNPLAGCGVDVRPVMTMLARVMAVRSIAAGEAVGYNRCWVSGRPSRIATLGIGYGDGYPRHAPNGTPVWINGRVAPLVGRVSMDSIGVDVTDCDDIVVGDEATLWGSSLSVAKIAEHAGTINYALLTGVSQRVSREYELPDRGRDIDQRKELFLGTPTG